MFKFSSLGGGGGGRCWQSAMFKTACLSVLWNQYTVRDFDQLWWNQVSFSQGSDSSVTSPQGAPSFAVATPNQPALAPVTPTTPSNPSSPGRKRSASEAFGPNLTALPAEVILEEGEDDDCDDNDTVGSSTPPPDGAESENLLTAATVTPPAKKKRKDVSPDKYFEVWWHRSVWRGCGSGEGEG